MSPNREQSLYISKAKIQFFPLGYVNIKNNPLLTTSIVMLSSDQAQNKMVSQHLKFNLCVVMYFKYCL